MIRTRPRRLLWALVVLACFAAGPAIGQEEKDALRPCTMAELVGTWEVIRFGAARSARVDRSDPYFYPHQRYVFSADATMRHLTSQTPMTPATHRALLSSATPSTWAVDGKGRLLMQREGEPRLETAACEVLTREVIDPKSGVASPPGDVLLTHGDPADKPVMRRQLRRLDRLGE